MNAEIKSIRLPQWLRTFIFGRKPKWTLARLGLLIISVFIVFNFVLTRPIRVTGRSMLPTYHDGQINFLNRLAYLRHEPQRGDVVGIRYSGEDVMLLKRIVGLPGEQVSFEEGKLFINGQALDEPYMKLHCNWTHKPLKLGPNDYYVVGDNRSMAWDDHEHGAADRRRIVGKVLFGGGT